MKYLFCSLFLFFVLNGFSQNLENSRFTTGSEYTVLSIEFEKENKITFKYSDCLGTDISKGKYAIISDTIHCEYKPFLIDYSIDSVSDLGIISDSIELSLLFHSLEIEDSCTLHIIDTLNSYYFITKVGKNEKISIKIPRNLNQLIIEFINKYNVQLEDFTNAYLSQKTQTNNFQLTVFNYSRSPKFWEYQKYYFDQNDPNVIWLVNSSNHIKLTRK